MSRLQQEFLVIGHAKTTDASAAAEASGLSVKQPISKRIVIATLSDTYKAIMSDEVADILAEIDDPSVTIAVEKAPPVTDKLVSIFNPADDRAILMTGLDQEEHEAVMIWRQTHSGFSSKM